MRAIGPTTSKSNSSGGKPPWRARLPIEGLKPTNPVCEAGRRIEPPPSVQSAQGAKPAAMEATAPPLEPPGVSRGSQGLRVVPNSGLLV